MNNTKIWDTIITINFKKLKTLQVKIKAINNINKVAQNKQKAIILIIIQIILKMKIKKIQMMSNKIFFSLI